MNSEMQRLARKRAHQMVLTSNLDSPSSAWKLDDSPSSAWKLDLDLDLDLAAQKLDLDNGGGSGGSGGWDLAACNGTWRFTTRSGGLDLNQDEDASANSFKDVSAGKFARDDASRVQQPATFDSGNRIGGAVHGPNFCASQDHFQFPWEDVKKSTHKRSGCEKPIHS